MNNFLIGALVFSAIISGGSYAYKKYWQNKLAKEKVDNHED